MRKLFLSVAFIGVAFAANAQKSEVVEAKKIWSIYELTMSRPEEKRAPSADAGTKPPKIDETPLSTVARSGGQGRPESAQMQKPRPSTYVGKQLAALYSGLEHSEKAITNDKSKDMPEAWTYRALFAASASYVDTIDVDNSIKYQRIAEESIAKANSLKPSTADKENISMAEAILTNAIRTRGVVAFNRKDIKTAYDIFVSISAKNPLDTGMYGNLGFLARELHDYPKSIEHYKKAISMKAADAPSYYGEIVKMELENVKDTAAAEAILIEASTKYPDDMFFVTNLTDIYITQGNNAKADALLDKLITKEPKNTAFIRAKANGYFNQAFELQAQIRKLESEKKFKLADEIIKRKNELLNKSLPLYLQIEEISPKDLDLIKMIKQIYFVLDNKAKADEYQKKQDALK